MSRYRVGCPGMFVLGTDFGCDGWIGPTSQLDIDEAKERLTRRDAARVAEEAPE